MKSVPKHAAAKPAERIHDNSQSEIGSTTKCESKVCKKNDVVNSHPTNEPYDKRIMFPEITNLM